MSKTTEAPTPQKPDGVITTQVKGQIFITEIFFNHQSKETFADKLIRVVSAKKIA